MGRFGDSSLLYVILVRTTLSLRGTSAHGLHNDCHESYYLPLEAVHNSTIVGGTIDIVPCHGSVAIVPGIRGNAAYFDGNTKVSLGEGRESCLLDPELCQKGMTLSMWIRFDNQQINDQYIFSNGGQTSDSYGYATLLQSKRLLVIIKTKTKQWMFRSSDEIMPHDWFFLSATWHVDHGVHVFRNETVLNGTKSFTSVSLSSTTFNGLLLGGPNNAAAADTLMSFKGVLDEITFCDRWMTDDEMLAIYQKELGNDVMETGGLYYTVKMEEAMTPQDLAITSENVHSFVLCLSLCNRRHYCMTATFSHDTGLCQLFNVFPSDVFLVKRGTATTYTKSTT